MDNHQDELNILWTFLRTGDVSNEKFRSLEKIPFTIEYCNGQIVVYCDDEFGKYEKCTISKAQLYSCIESICSCGEMKMIPDYENMLTESDYRAEMFSFLLPIAYYCAQAIKIPLSRHKISDANDKVTSINDDLPVYNALTGNVIETDMQQDDIERFIYTRNVYFHPQLESYFRKASTETREKIINIANQFASNSKDDLRAFLERKTNKRLKGTTTKIDKLYTDNSSGHRLLWCCGSDIDPIQFKDSIILLAYVEDHDKGQNRVGKNINLSVSYADVFLTVDSLLESTEAGFSHSIPPYKYKNGYITPQLTAEQSRYTTLFPPLLLQGSAGSGKTQVSTNIFKDLIKNGHSPVYITFTQELVIDVTDKLIIAGEKKESLRNRIYTLKEFYMSALNMKQADVIFMDYDGFSKWKSREYLHKSVASLKNIDSLVAWTYIRGVIKGGVIANSLNEIPSLSDFEKWMKKKEKCEDSFCIQIYQIGQDYIQYCQNKYNKKQILDDNELARLVLKNSLLKGKFDVLIIDEAQDLTYIQIAALQHCVNNDQLYFCGDQNQRIHPTVIDLNSLGRFFLSSHKTFNSICLGSSFRTSKGVIRFVNHLSNLRREYIGCLDQKIDVVEMSARESNDGFWATKFTGNRTDLLKICSLANEASNCIVIVPDTETKNKLLIAIPELETRVRTVFESKGLEYDNVILFNFVSSNREVFEKILNRKMLKNSFGRLLFNMLYVASTRAKERLIICEEIVEDSIQSEIFEGIVSQDSYDEVTRYLGLRTDDKGWIDEAYRLEKIGDYVSAKNAYRHVSNIKYEKSINRCNLMIMYLEMIASEISTKSFISNICDIAEQLISNDDYELAEDLYRKIIEEYGPENYRAGLIITMLKQGKKVTCNEMNIFIHSSDFANIEDYIVNMKKYFTNIIGQNEQNIFEMNNLLIARSI